MVSLPALGDLAALDCEVLASSEESLLLCGQPAGSTTDQYWIDRVSRCVLRLGLVRTNGSVLVLVMIIILSKYKVSRTKSSSRGQSAKPTK